MSKRVRRTPPPTPQAPAAPASAPEAPAPAPLPPAPGRAQADAAATRVAELGALEARYVASLPAPATMLCRTQGGIPFAVTTGRKDWEAARLRSVAVFAGDEWTAMVVAALQDRAAPFALEEWCRTKRGTPLWELTPTIALGGLVHLEPTQRVPITVAQVLRAFGAVLRVVPATVPAADDDWVTAYHDGGSRW